MNTVSNDVLVVGTYRPDGDGFADHVRDELGRARRWSVDQRWVACAGRVPAAASDADVVPVAEHRFPAVNAVLRQVDLSRYAYVVVCDDALRLPPGFLDGYLERVERSELALAQPASLHGSGGGGPAFATQLPGIEARATRFVAAGSLISIARAAYDVLLPFDEASPRGEGYELVWPVKMQNARLRMGIVDACPIARASRPGVSDAADEKLVRSYLAQRSHLEDDEVFSMARRPARRPTLGTPQLSVLLCTWNRASLLRRTLESFCRQTLPRSEFEIVVVDDGSVDDTPAVVDEFADRLPVYYAYQRNAGLAAARNHALFLARGPLVLMQDDDDVAAPDLLAEHLRSYRSHEDVGGVLGFTALAPEIASDPLMHYVTAVGKNLFCYGDLRHGQKLGFAWFWGGRSSARRDFLLRHGVFDPVFRFGCEDIELAFRLERHGFKVVYNAKAVTTMLRPFTVDEFCRRCEKQGRSNWVFSRLHADAAVQRWTGVEAALRGWERLAPRYDAILQAARTVDTEVRAASSAGPVPHAMTSALHQAYAAAFQASTAKGTWEMSRGMVASA